MKKQHAVAVLAALSQPVRLEVFLLLAHTLPDGMASGEIAIATASSPNTMSAHLAILSRAGLVKSVKVGRNVVYRAVRRPVNDLAMLLTEVSLTDRTERDASG